MLREWGGEIKGPYPQEEYTMNAYRMGDVELTRLLQSELGGRRCEFIDLTTRANLNGNTCVAEEYLSDTDKYKVTVEPSKKNATPRTNHMTITGPTTSDCSKNRMNRQTKI